jgi:hypothetical protein
MLHEEEPVERDRSFCIEQGVEFEASSADAGDSVRTPVEGAGAVMPKIRRTLLRELYGSTVDLDDPFFSFTSISDVLQFQHEVLRVGSLVASSAAAVAIYKGIYQLMKLWVDERNGRKLKIKVGDIEVEATQMKEEDVIRLLELLQEKADRRKIRELLLQAGKDGGRPQGH